jgi:RNA polymerase sigma factor (TIGR02999 family)
MPDHPEPVQDVTEVLAAGAAGDPRAADRLLTLVYAELRALAQSHLVARGGGDQTLQATAIVHEAYLRLVDQKRAQYRDRNHFFAVAATVIRRVLVDAARAKAAAKRGGDWTRLTLDSALGWTGPHEVDLVALDDALRRLGELSERQSRVVELRFFAGLSIEQASEALGVSTTTVENEWAIARAWLRRELAGESGAKP